MVEVIVRIITRHAAADRRGVTRSGDINRGVITAQTLMEKLSTEVGGASAAVTERVVALDDEHAVLEVGGDLRLQEPEIVTGREAADLARAEAGDVRHG